MNIMTILALRTDNPTAELYVYSNGQQIAARQWHGHRQLGETLHTTIKEVLAQAGLQTSHIQGVVAYQGPGSFTGLRIGLTVANALAYSNGCPVVAEQGQDWVATGIDRLQSGHDDGAALPHYDSPVFTTRPRK